jgi:hypothetical protein
VVSGQLKCAFSRNKRRYDARVKAVQFKVGDFVWYYTPRGTKGLSRKWELRTQGPYRIVRRVNFVNYVIQRSESSKPFICHVDRMRAFKGTLPEHWRKITGVTEWPADGRYDQRFPSADRPTGDQCQARWIWGPHRQRIGCTDGEARNMRCVRRLGVVSSWSATASAAAGATTGATTGCATGSVAIVAAATAAGSAAGSTLGSTAGPAGRSGSIAAHPGPRCVRRRQRGRPDDHRRPGDIGT